MADDKKDSIFKKVLMAGESTLDRFIAKNRSDIIAEEGNKLLKARSDIASEEDDAIYRKSVYSDLTYSTGAQGFQEKSSVLSYIYQSQMAKKDCIVAAIIQTYQNKVAAHATISKDKYSKGFKIKLKAEEDQIQKIMKEMFGDEEKSTTSNNNEEKSGQNKDIAVSGGSNFNKAGAPNPNQGEETQPDPEQELQEEGQEQPLNQDDLEEADENERLTDREKRRIAKEELQKRNKQKIEAIQQLVLSCGELKDRPFESRKWNFDAYLRASVRDRYTYDQMATETVPDASGKLSYWVPVDGGTIRFATAALSRYKDLDNQNAGLAMLYPEKELEALENQRDALVLDEEKLENNDYKYIQLVRNRIVRAFTPDEMSLGMANPTTDIYSNGYSVSELELLVQTISSHIFTENYNRSYFTQGFSAKGILHVKANINRRKLETLRVQWNHMIKGNRNSFQTPILSGMEEVKWIPLSQSHADMEFNNWMNYLIKIICAVYQIDPFEIGFGMKDEGGGGSSMSGDNSQQKLEISKTKGFVPLLKFIQNYINVNIIDKIDPNFELEFVGIDSESQGSTLNRQKEEVKFKKSVNEVREEDNLPPIPGADDLLLDPTYMTWFTTFHPEGKKKVEEDRKIQSEQASAQLEAMKSQQGQPAQEGAPGEEPYQFEKALKNNERPIKIEYFKIKKD